MHNNSQSVSSNYVIIVLKHVSVVISGYITVTKTYYTNIVNMLSLTTKLYLLVTVWSIVIVFLLIMVIILTKNIIRYNKMQIIK